MDEQSGRRGGGDEPDESAYRAVVEAFVDDVWRAGPDGALRTDMPTWRAATGQTEAQIRGLGWLDAVHPDDRAELTRVIARAQATGAPWTAEYRIAPPGLPAAGRDEAARTFLIRAVPVRRGGEIVEWLGVSNDVTALRHASRERARLAEAARLAAERTRALQQVTAALSGAVSRSDVIGVILEVSALSVAAVGRGVALLDDDGETIHYHLLTGYADSVRAEWADFPRSGHSPVTHVLRTGEPLFVSGQDTMLEMFPSEAIARFVQQTGERAWARLPLATTGGTFGVLSLGFADERSFEAEERDLLVGIAGQCAQALERSTLYERAEERARLQSVLSEASHVLSGSLERHEILARLARLTVPALGDWTAVHLLGEEEGRDAVVLAAVTHHDPERQGDLRRRLEWNPARLEHEHGAGHAIRTGSSEIITDPSEALRDGLAADDVQRQALRRAPLHSALVVPLTARGRTVGAMSCVRERDGRHTATELTFAEDLGRRAALAIDNAALYESQRDVAMTLQRSLLPQSLPQLDDVGFGARYLPGHGGTEVGGDWYDGFELDGGRVGVVVGDVMGRGVRAAAVMGQVRSTLRGYALEGHPPAEVLQRLDAVVRAFPDLQLTTCLYAVLDPAAHRLRLASAGHLPPLLVEAAGARFLDVEPGLPLGVGGARFVEQEVVLPEPATLVLYTDGLVESRGVALDDGLRQLQRVLDRAGGLAPYDVHEMALAGLDRDAGHDDDTAVLVVRLAPGAGRHVPRLLVMDLPPTAASARAARGALSDALLRWGHRHGPTRDTVLLLTSEVVTNGVLHAGSPLVLRAELTGDRLLVAVTDDSLQRPRHHGEGGDGPPVGAESGRGLWLLDALATEWGADPAPGGKRVWFTVDLAARD